MMISQNEEEEEEAMIEIEAVKSIYGGDCHVIDKFPPHLAVHLKPRTADDISLQFVEADLRIRADAQYPKKPPQIEIIDSKGLDDRRQAHLISVVQEKAQEFASCPMLVLLCEEAVDALSNMNHPDGDCPLCLDLLFTDVGQNDSLPFMKLMSCFHCFHSQCIVRWWEWLQDQNQTNNSCVIETSTTSTDHENWRSSEVNNTGKWGLGNCPVCRKVFHAKDIDHVLNLVGASSTEENLEANCISVDEMEFLQSEQENDRRKKYAEILKRQEEIKGLIEPKRTEVLQPGVYLPERVTLSVASPATSSGGQDEGCSDNPPSQTDLSTSSCRNSTRKHNNASVRKSRGNHRRKPVNGQSSRKQWVKKEQITSE